MSHLRFKQKVIVKWPKIVSCMVLLTMLCSLFPFSQVKADSSEGCDKIEHQHGEACYERLLQCGWEVPVDSAEEKALLDPAAADEAIQEEAAMAADEEGWTDGAAHMAGVHEHDEGCYVNDLICVYEAHTHEGACMAEPDAGDEEEESEPDTSQRELVYEDEVIKVTVQLLDAEDLPEETTLSVTVISPEEERFVTYREAIEQQLDTEDQLLSEVNLYDITFRNEGEEVQPAQKVEVSFTYKTADAFTEEEIGRAGALKVLHVVEDGDTVVAEELSGEVDAQYAEDALSQVDFSTKDFSVYAIALYDTTVSGAFYYQTDAIDMDSEYLIVSVNGSHAIDMGASNPANSKRLTVNPVHGHPGYFSVEEDVTANMLFAFSDVVSGEANVQIKSKTNRYVVVSNDNLFTTKSGTSYVMRNSAGTWRIGASADQTDFYLSDFGDGFVRGRSEAGTEGEGAHKAAFHNMMILKKENTTLVIPGNVAQPDAPSGGDVQKPSYPPYRETSPEHEEVMEAYERKTTFASDRATSKLEAVFTGNRLDDGRVMTDKSVIYMGDDYDAYEYYDESTFGVTLSALAQAPRVEHTTVHSAPMDVIFVLDISSSMDAVVNGETRLQTMVTALNSAIHHIMAANPANRVGIVYFNSASEDFLQLGRYYVSSSLADPDYSGAAYEYIRLDSLKLMTNNFLRDEKSKKKVDLNVVVTGGGTYTQRGVQQAAEMFLRQTDTTHITDDGTEVSRIPLTVLLSDGIATYGSANYTNPTRGPHYGSGASEIVPYDYTDNVTGSKIIGDHINVKGILGYYTVLSANYFKQIVGNHYERPAKFSTIGMGIYADDEGGSKYAEAADPQIGIGDDYVRAILDPSEENLLTTTSNPNAPNGGVHGPQLFDLLENRFPGDAITVRFNGDDGMIYLEDLRFSPLGMTNIVMPVLKNPYEDYAYADSAYFGATMDADRLSQIMDEIIVSSEEGTVYVPGKTLKRNSYLTITDTLGAEMEVVSNFVLRYDGQEYPLEQIYQNADIYGDGSMVWKIQVQQDHYVKNAAGEYVSLLSMNIIMRTSPEGETTIIWDIPDDLLPEYRLNTQGGYYDEMLPIRLFYIAALPWETPETTLADGDYFVGRWEDGAGARAVFTPHYDNTYYHKLAGKKTTLPKGVNTTGTNANYFQVASLGTDMEIRMGNNGKVTILEKKIAVTAEKKWATASGKIVSGFGKPGVIVGLFRKHLGESGLGTLVPVSNNPVQLDENAGWTHQWTDLPKLSSSGRAYRYYVAEASLDGYDTFYELSDGTSGTVAADLVFFEDTTVTVTNRSQATAEDTGQITVQKSWTEANGTPLSEDLIPDSIQVSLKGRVYRSDREVDPIANFGDLVPYGEPVRTYTTATLSKSNNWEVTWDGLTLVEYNPGGQPFYLYTFYFVEEAVPEGFTAFYSDNNKRAMEGKQPGLRDDTVLITNTYASFLEMLPETGGPGIWIITGMGLVLAALPPIKYIAKRKNGGTHHRKYGVQ